VLEQLQQQQHEQEQLQRDQQAAASSTQPAAASASRPSSPNAAGVAPVEQPQLLSSVTYTSGLQLEVTLLPGGTYQVVLTALPQLDDLWLPAWQAAQLEAAAAAAAAATAAALQQTTSEAQEQDSAAAQEQPGREQAAITAILTDGAATPSRQGDELAVVAAAAGDEAAPANTTEQAVMLSNSNAGETATPDAGTAAAGARPGEEVLVPLPAGVVPVGLVLHWGVDSWALPAEEVLPPGSHLVRGAGGGGGGAPMWGWMGGWMGPGCVAAVSSCWSACCSLAADMFERLHEHIAWRGKLQATWGPSGKGRARSCATPATTLALSCCLLTTYPAACTCSMASAPLAALSPCQPTHPALGSQAGRGRASPSPSLMPRCHPGWCGCCMPRAQTPGCGSRALISRPCCALPRWAMWCRVCWARRAAPPTGPCCTACSARWR
jgi:hypothetical protein